ncbi:MAG TPA: phage virion morphogenesis protein [Azoarcus taiwanensis]|nr:phage virion morphogenesis protein [Azoarcus taiwanensis]
MADRITIDFAGDDLVAALTQLYEGLGPAGMRGPLDEIGEHLAESTRQRFVAGAAPDGSPWAPNAEATYLGLLSSRDARKDGRINARGTAKVRNKKPLVDSGILAEQITWQLLPDGSGVAVGTNRFAGDWDAGAAVHQFGSRDGRIPSRPFLGLSAEDEAATMRIIDRYLAGLMGA